MNQEEPTVHPYIANSAPAVKGQMLKEVGAERVQDFYEDVPENLRLKGNMDLPKPFLSEYAVKRHIEGILAKNKTCEDYLSFLGAGCWQHHVPAVCDEVNRRGEFLTAYAGEPYDDHGSFQALFEYASMMGELLNMTSSTSPRTTASKLPPHQFLGIPAGVKIHSAVFANNPTSAGDLAVSYLQGKVCKLREAGVMDIDEEAVRQGTISAKLYGYVKIPFQRRLLQGLKTPSSPGQEAAMATIAASVVSEVKDDWLYIIGPGTTTRAITSRLGLDKTLIGVDVVAEGELVAVDVNESRLLELLEGRSAKIVVTPIGGQGYIFGRGNQQISPRVIEKVGKENIIVVSTTEKIYSLGGRPLWVDTGNRSVDRMLSGHIRVVTGYNEQIIYRVAC